MDELKFWGKCASHFNRLKGLNAAAYGSYYIQRSIEKSCQVVLPKKIVSSSNGCVHCGASWFKCIPKVRIDPGHNPSKSARKLIKLSKKNKKISQFHQTLLQKVLKNRANKIIMKCQLCPNITKINLDKLHKPRLSKISKAEIFFTNSSIKKKRKKKKGDKSAGLNVSNIEKSDLCEKQKESLYALKPANVKQKLLKQIATPINQMKKMNLGSSNDVKNQDGNNKKNLNNFLKELY